MTVSEFVARINTTLRSAHPGTWVRGEAGEGRVWPSGHAYFSLKDGSAKLPSVRRAGRDLNRAP